jgi:hypothetical protein
MTSVTRSKIHTALTFTTLTKFLSFKNNCILSTEKKITHADLSDMVLLGRKQCLININKPDLTITIPEKLLPKQNRQKTFDTKYFL